MKTKKIPVKCEVVEKSENEVDFLLYGPIINEKLAWYDDDEYTCPQQVQDKLKKAEGKQINLHINSYGGDAFAGIAICNQLKNYEGKVVAYIDSIAASAASIIAMGADEIIMPNNAMMMVHNAWTWTAGNANELRAEADKLDKINSSVRQSYMDKFVGTEEELIQLLDDESYLTSEECVTLGFANSVYKQEPQQKQELNIKASILNKYKKPEEAKTNILNKFRKEIK
ncbi:head maturation protease, ClpP-related [Metaclostridioides mangenotii]|uniref:ATP-dependent protease ClpP protease subunit n=1 Tax=Metaclostridioides mangenotii TaxID=1540 RepID=A0ABS4E6Z2_9FIRM|nr:head maturation protease, ClpP-related [Clostridioides mangenotii]MBP1853713.1 ATP-dependent protease ClpP protease subunit [Clostridioides mangenotii]